MYVAIDTAIAVLMRPIAQAARICFQTPISKLDMAKIAESFAPPVEAFHAGNDFLDVTN